MSEERREFTRVFVHVRAEVSFLDGKKIQAESFDLSMKGISLEGGTTDLIGRECSVNIALNAPPEVMQIKSTGVVTQCHDGRMGILFHSVVVRLVHVIDEGEIDHCSLAVIPPADRR